MFVLNVKSQVIPQKHTKCSNSCVFMTCLLLLPMFRSVIVGGKGGVLFLFFSPTIIVGLSHCKCGFQKQQSLCIFPVYCCTRRLLLWLTMIVNKRTCLLIVNFSVSNRTCLRVVISQKRTCLLIVTCRCKQGNMSVNMAICIFF